MGRKIVLKLSGHNEEKEINFELDFLRSLSIRQRFELMAAKTREMIALLDKNGHRKAFQIIKRT
ncbi:MAG: hypothetical protein HY746_05725 [Elusimicrobia bacterium]|nr:hypothetical protein [Elusimicrobiota bacterium]